MTVGADRSAQIAPGASVDVGAELGLGVVVGHGAVIERGVSVGDGTRVLPGTVLHSGTVVGSGCRLGPYAVIGGEPMDSAFAGEPSSVVLEDRVHVREFATVHRATGEGAQTRVGSGALLMSYVHVSHNVVVGEGCVLTTAVQIGGHCEVGNRAVVGSASVLHQFCRVGTHAMYGAASASNMDILPYSLARGNPARHYRLNGVGLKRSGIEGERYRLLERALRAVRRRDLDELAGLAGESAEAAVLLEFIQTSKRGVLRFVKAS